MTLEEGLYSYLSSTAALTALVGNRIYPVVLPPNVVYPAVTYQRISGPRVHTMGNDPGLAYPRIQISCWYRDISDPQKGYGQVKAVAEQIRLALQDQKNTTWGGSVTVRAVLFDGDTDLYDFETQVHQVALDFIIWYTE